MEAALQNIAWRKIAEPIPFEQAEVGDIFIWISDDRDQFTLDFRGTLYALKGDMGVVVTKQYSNLVGNFLKDAYRRACFITSQKVDIYKAEDYDTIDMERYNKKGNPPKLSWRIFDNVSFEELPHVLGPNQIWKASISDPEGQYPYFITGPNGAFLEIQKHLTQEPFIVVANAMWTRDINAQAWNFEGNIHKNFTPFTLVSKDTIQSSDQNLEDFLNGLTPDDIGEEVMGPYLVAFEGFNPTCWEDAEKQGKPIDDLEKEILAEWVNKYQSQYIRHGWARGGEFGADDIFYAVFPNMQKLSWKIVDIKEGDSVKITKDKGLLHHINIISGDRIAGELGTVILVDPEEDYSEYTDSRSYKGAVRVTVAGDNWAFPLSHWQQFLTVVNNSRLAWKAIFEPDKDVATVMYALSGTDYPFVISVLLGLSDITSRAILGALAVGGYEEASQEFDKFIEDCNSIVDGAMVHYNVNNIDTDTVKEYATTLPDFMEMGDRWSKLSQILKELSSTTVNKKTSSIGEHVAWHFQTVPEVNPSTRAFIKTFLKTMATSPIAIAPFTRGFGSKTYLSNLKAALRNDNVVALYNDVVWLENKSNDFLDIAHLEMAQRNVTSISFDTILTVQEQEEYSQKYEALYNTFQQIVGGDNG